MIAREEIAVAATANKATTASYSASIGTVLVGGLSLNEWAAVAGIVGTIITVAANIYFRLREARFREGKS